MLFWSTWIQTSACVIFSILLSLLLSWVKNCPLASYFQTHSVSTTHLLTLQWETKYQTLLKQQVKLQLCTFGSPGVQVGDNRVQYSELKSSQKYSQILFKKINIKVSAQILSLPGPIMKGKSYNFCCSSLIEQSMKFLQDTCHKTWDRAGSIWRLASYAHPVTTSWKGTE